MQQRQYKLDLRLTEIETKVTTEIRRLIIQECLQGCKTENPDCPYLESTKICGVIQDVLDEDIPKILKERNRSN